MQRRYLSNPVFFFNDQCYSSNRNYWICPENNKTQPSIMPFNKVLHQKAFTMFQNAESIKRGGKKPPYIQEHLKDT